MDHCKGVPTQGHVFESLTETAVDESYSYANNIHTNIDSLLSAVLLAMMFSPTIVAAPEHEACQSSHTELQDTHNTNKDLQSPIPIISTPVSSTVLAFFHNHPFIYYTVPSVTLDHLTKLVKGKLFLDLLAVDGEAESDSQFNRRTGTLHRHTQLLSSSASRSNAL